jgi:pimeloyl-ACP methyl ester carboxylesterase
MTIGHDGHRPISQRCTTPDGLGIVLYDFGGTGHDLLLVHATGFCAEVFGPLADQLSKEFHCWGLDLRAHGRSDRPADGNFEWSGFATDVRAAIDRLGLDHPFGFGHSCGGAAILLAEEATPGTFRALYCFEPVIFPEPIDQTIFERNPLSKAARRRREEFPSADDALANFSSKPPFSDLDPEVLELYVHAAFELVPQVDGGDGRAIRLRCRRDDEAEVYAHAASHGAFARLSHVECPVTLACGETTDAFGLTFLEADADQLPHPTVEVVPEVGHFGPLQRPAVVAASMARALNPEAGTPGS